MNKEFIEILQNLTILIVEDNLSQREKLKDILLLFTKKIIIAENGEEGLFLFEKHRPSLIFTDIKMPKVDGIEFAKRIRGIDKKVPIIILTAYTNKEFLLQAVSLHLVNYIEKPIVEENLIASLEDAVSQIKQNLLIKVELQDGHLFNILEKCIYKNDEKISLTKKELVFLEYLLEYKNTVVKKEDIEALIWPDGGMTKAALKNFIFKLRKKVGYDSIQTSSSYGFSLKINS